MTEKFMGVEHLLAATIVAAGGELRINQADLESPEIEGKSIALDLDEGGLITMRLVEFDE